MALGQSKLLVPLADKARLTGNQRAMEHNSSTRMGPVSKGPATEIMRLRASSIRSGDIVSAVDLSTQ